MTRLGALNRPNAPVGVPSLFSGLAALITAISLFEVAAHGVRQPWTAAVFGLTIAIGEAIRLELPNGREAAPLSSTAALAFALCISVGGTATSYGTMEVTAVTALATLCGVSVQAYVGRQPRAGYLARRILVVFLVALIYRGWLLSGPLKGVAGRPDFYLLADHHDLYVLRVALAVGALGAVVLDHALAVFFAQFEPVNRSLSQLAPYHRGPSAGVVGPRSHPKLSVHRLLIALWDDCRGSIRLFPTIVLFSVAIALMAGPVGLWALLIAATPILVIQRSLRRYSAISATYQQTIRALSRVTELAGYTEPGHARRVCRLALAIGRDLSLAEHDLVDLEYAALLHDIGQLSLTDPIPGGATVLISPERAASVACLGAAVVRQTGVLDQVADILEGQSRPFCPEAAHEPVALASAIIRAANAYDDLAGGAGDVESRLSAVQRIRLGIAVDYDPRVVESLTRVVEAVEYLPC